MAEKRSSLMLTSTVLCAALYAIGSYITSYIVSPWGVGQFRPAVVIPTLFAIIFGPLPAGTGAAIGTLIADSANIGSFNMGSLIAAVPGNFFGFYMMGYILQRRFTWGRYILSVMATLIFANLVVAVLYVGVYLNLFMGQFPNLDSVGLSVFIVGLTIWWFVTMLPFELLVAPPLIRAAVQAFPSIVPEDVAKKTIGSSITEEGLSTSLLLPGFIMLGIGAAMMFTGLGTSIAGFFGPAAKSLIEVLSYASGAILVVLGLYFVFRKK
jgi:hypothetical protein